MIRNALARFMYGRYGTDTLNRFLFGLYLALYLVILLTDSSLCYLLSMVVLAVFVFRTLSRNFPKRREENAKFQKLAAPVLKWLRLRRTIHRDRDHVYFKCPSCGQQLRVPRGKGKITVTCRSCKAVFQEKS